MLQLTKFLIKSKCISFTILKPLLNWLHELDRRWVGKVLILSNFYKFLSEIVVVFQELVNEATWIHLKQCQWCLLVCCKLLLRLNWHQLRRVNDVSEFSHEITLVVHELDSVLNVEPVRDFQKVKFYFLSYFLLLNDLRDHLVFLI